MTDLTSTRGGRRTEIISSPGVPESLRHRGGIPRLRPDATLFAALGGTAGVHRLVDALYDRIAADPLLRHVFPHPDVRDGAKRFFVEWFGGEAAYSAALQPGLARTHQHLFVSPQGAAAWLRCMAEALDACAAPRAPVMQLLAPMAMAMVNRQDVPDPETLLHQCSFTQDDGAIRIEQALEDVAKGRTAAVQRALTVDPLLACGRGLHGQTLLWAAVYKNRQDLVQLLLDAGADPSLPACDPPRGEIASNRVRPGTILGVTPLALARKHHPQLAPILAAHGAVDDVFTAAWLGDLAGVAEWLDRDPDLVNAPDPAEDFQQVTPLAHAVASGEARVASLLIARGAEVRAHSGQLLSIAILLNRPDLVALLLEHGADARRAGSLGPLDQPEHPIADLLVAHGAGVPDGLLARSCRADVSRNEVHRVGVLLGYGADVNARSREGLTALHYAVRSGKLPLIRLLLDHGADVHAADPAGLTPFEHLVKSRAKIGPVAAQAIRELLVSRGAEAPADPARPASVGGARSGEGGLRRGSG